jgi:glycosyltransferase involved in cell wall biosynthesis
LSALLSSVSVVICAYNEEAHIARLLRSLGRQTLPPSEVIVIDDGSTDRTASIARQQFAQVICVPHRGPAVGRNLGAQSALGDMLVFLDGDMDCAPQFIECLTAPIRRGEAVGTFTREIYVANEKSAWASAYAVMRQLRGGRLLPEDFTNEWDNFRAITRDAFLSVDGYDNVGYGEDRTLARKLGAMAVVAPGAVCFHYNPDSPFEIFSNGRWIGRGAQIRELDRPWRDHLPHRVARWLANDIHEMPWAIALIARGSYHAGVLLGLAESTLCPRRHWK